MREALLLRAIESEVDGKAFMFRGLVEAATIAVTRTYSIPTVVRRSIDFVMQGHALLGLQPRSVVAKQKTEDFERKQILEQAAAFKVLKGTEFMDRMQKVLDDFEATQ